MSENAVQAPPATEFQPVIVGFTCNWCSYRAADLAGTARMKYPPNIRLVRLMCSGRIDPVFVLEAFAQGADGVLITGCWPGDCHYLEQNYFALRRFHLLKRTLEALGLEGQRIKLVWASAAEGLRLSREFTTFVEQVRSLGPLHWDGLAMGTLDVLSDLADSAPAPGPPAGARDAATTGAADSAPAGVTA